MESFKVSNFASVVLLLALFAPLAKCQWPQSNSYDCAPFGSTKVQSGHRRHPNSSCYELGSRGPCGAGMNFQQNPLEGMEGYGYCDCYRKGYSSRMMVYVAWKDACYTVFSQGPCDHGEWLIVNMTKTEDGHEKYSDPFCSPSLCPEYSCGEPNQSDPLSSNYCFYHHEKKRCFIASTRSQTTNYCERIGESICNVYKLYPVCGCAFPVSLTNYVAVQCSPGSKLRARGNCKEGKPSTRTGGVG